MNAYPVVLIPDGDQIMVQFPDFPEAVTCGADEAEALQLAADCLEETIAARIGDREPIPVPSPVEPGQRIVVVPLSTMFKALVWNTMKEQNIRRADLARRLSWTQKQVDRLLDPYHASKIEGIQAALNALRVTIECKVVSL